MKIKLLIITLAALLYCTTASADMYKWVDGSGVTHYSQLPPDGVEAEVIEQRGKTKSTYRRLSQEDLEEEEENSQEDLAENEFETDAAEDPADQLALAGEDALKNAEELAAAEKKRIEEEERNICKQATQNLIAMESRPIVRVKEGDDYRVLSAAEKDAKTAETRELITKYCR